MDSSISTFRIRGPKGKVEIITISSTSSFQDLFNKISEIFSIEYGTFELLTGFPPEPCGMDEELCLDGNIATNTVLTVRMKSSDQFNIKQASSTTGAAGNKKKGKETASSSSSSSSSNSNNNGKNATAVVKISKTGEIIHTTKITTSAQTKKKSSSSNNNNFATLAPSTSATSAQFHRSSSNGNNNNHILSFSNRSSNGTNNTNKVPRKRGTRMSKQSAGSENDIADHLIAAAEGGSGNRSKTFRTVFRSAVQGQYKSSLSTARLAASVNNTFEIEFSENVRLLESGERTKIKVSFKSNPSSRSRDHTDEVDLLSKELIKALIIELFAQKGTSGGREFLKPENLSFASPRIFWSLIYHYGTNFRHIFEILFPDCTDFSWVSKRKRDLSEKAIINLEQQKEKARIAALKQTNSGNNTSNNSKRKKKCVGDTDDNMTTENDISNSNINNNNNNNQNSSTATLVVNENDVIQSALNGFYADLNLVGISTNAARNINNENNSDEDNAAQTNTNTSNSLDYLEPLYLYLSSSSTAVPSITATSSASSSSPPLITLTPTEPSILVLANISTSHEGALNEVVFAMKEIKLSMQHELSMNTTDDDGDGNNNNNNTNSGGGDGDGGRRYKRKSHALDVDTSFNSDNNDNTGSHSMTTSSSSSSPSSTVQSNTLLTKEVLESCIQDAQHDILHAIWSFLCGGSARLKRALIRAKVTSPSLLAVWKIAPDALYDTLLQLDYHLDAVAVISHCVNSNNNNSGNKGNTNVSSSAVATSKLLKDGVGTVEPTSSAKKKKGKQSTAAVNTNDTRRNISSSSSESVSSTTNENTVNNNADNSNQLRGYQFTLFNRQYLQHMCLLADAFQHHTSPTSWLSNQYNNNSSSSSSRNNNNNNNIIININSEVILDVEEDEEVIEQEDKSIAQYMYRKPAFNATTSFFVTNDAIEATTVAATYNTKQQSSSSGSSISNNNINIDGDNIADHSATADNSITAVDNSDEVNDNITTDDVSSINIKKKRNYTDAFDMNISPTQTAITDITVTTHTDDITDGIDVVEMSTSSSSSSSSSAALTNGIHDNTVVDDANENEEDDGWLYNESDHEYIGMRVRCLMSPTVTFDTTTSASNTTTSNTDSNNMDDNRTSNNSVNMNSNQQQQQQQQRKWLSHKYSWYEDGTVVGYLPPSECEPMALWRVCLDCTHDHTLEIAAYSATYFSSSTTLSSASLSSTAAVDTNIASHSSTSSHSSSAAATSRSSSLLRLRLKQDTETKSRQNRRSLPSSSSLIQSSQPNLQQQSQQTARFEDLENHEVLEFGENATLSYIQFVNNNH